MIREKQDAANLKLRYASKVRMSVVLTFLMHILGAVFLPSLEQGGVQAREVIEPLLVEQIPPTTQVKRPPPMTRPAVPIETEDESIPDDVTIAETNLDLDAPIIDFVPTNFDSTSELEEEILEFWAVEEQPKIAHRVNPVYPEMARRAGLEGQVILSFVVGADGRATDFVVLRGAEIFREAAIEAATQFRFRPAKQNDRSVAVRMTLPLSFKLR